MKSKILTVLGVLMMMFAIGTFVLFDAQIKQNTLGNGVYVLVAKEHIPDGTVLKTTEMVAQYLGVKYVPRNIVLEGAVEISPVIQETNLLEKYLHPNTDNIFLSEQDKSILVNKKIVGNKIANEQITISNLSNDTTEFKEDERLVSLQTDIFNLVGGEVKKGDYVDIWVEYADATGNFRAEKVLEKEKVLGLKNESGIEITNSIDMPSIAIFKFNEEKIKIAKIYSQKGNLFLTKYGVNPF